MIQTSFQSIIGQQKRSKDNGRPGIWYDGIIDLIIDNVERIEEEDVTIVVESSIYAMGVKKEQEESTSFQDEDDEDENIDNPFNIDEFEPASFGRESPRVKSRTGLRGNLFTISNYFDWRTSSEGYSEDNVTIDESVTDEHESGIFSSDTALVGWPLNNFFSNNTRTDGQKRVIALTAWFMSFIGLIVSLSILTSDFIASIHQTASTVHLESSDGLNLPNIWFCTSDTFQPLFFDIPNGYSGQPLFWVDYVRGTSRNLNLMYPETRQMTQMKFTSIDPQGKECNLTKNMEVKYFNLESYVAPTCFHCITIQQTPPLVIKNDLDLKSLEKVSSSSASFRFSRQSFLSFCRTAQYSIRVDNHIFFRNSIKMHSDELATRGIIDFGGLDPKDGANDGFLFPVYRLGGLNTSVDFFVYDVVDMYCNVYMFSGFFYPSSESTDIRFKFDSTAFRWERNGNGPYFPLSFFEFYIEPETFEDIESRMIGEEMFDHRATRITDRLYIMTNASEVGSAGTLAVLKPGEYANIAFSRNEINGEVLYRARSMGTDLLRGDSRSINHVYFVEFHFKGFFTRKVTQQQAMSWTAFLADFFGLTSLFLDISVYSVLVSPVSGRKAPGQQKSRKKANAKAKREMKTGYRR